VLAIGVISTSLVAAWIVPSNAQTGGEAPTATDVGVTAKEIHVATIADVDNPFAPGLFKGAKVGAEAAAKYLNSKAGGGGIGGRKVVVDFIDSKLNANDSRNGVITACQNDFAMVGGAMLFLGSADDLDSCPDKQGAATGLPDLAAFATSVVESCSPVSFPVSPPQLDCKTAQSSPQKYTSNAGLALYLVKKYGKGKVHGAMIYSTDTKDAERGSRAILDAWRAAGIKADQYAGLSARVQQSAYTPIINQMKADKSNFGASFSSLPNMVSEAQLQGLTGVTWAGSYAQGGGKADPGYEGMVADLHYLPFDEAKTNRTLAAYLKWLPSADDRDQYSAFSWTAMLAFASAAREVVDKKGINGLTRKSLLDTGVPTLTSFDANGMIGAVDIAHKVSSPCYLIEQIKNGAFHRVYPAKPGTFDCKKSNLVTTQADYVGG
jgi:hypothetical protein